MKIDVEATTSRCEAGNMESRIVVAIDTAGGYGSNPPTLSAIDHALDGARKAIVAVIDADRKRAA